jgi:hypothetical protein
MLISFAVALAFPQDLDPDLTRYARLPESHALFEAAGQWMECLDFNRDRFEPSGESAVAIAKAALFVCQPKFTAQFQASIALRMALQPDAVERDVRQEEIEQNERRFQTQEWRIVHDVVALRLARRQ